MRKVLLVDDDDHLRSSFYNLLVAEGYLVQTAASGEEALKMAAEELPDAVIMDVRMPGIDGLTALKKLHELEPRLPVIIMTAYSTTEAAIEATKLGAFDYVLKPFDIPDILDLLNKALEAGRVMRGKVVFSADTEEGDADALVGISRAMHQVYKAIGRVAQTDALVLLTGESGTGKELVARAIYQHSLRNAKPFSIINCVAIPDTLLESELFGYERGAFTGASTRRIGKIEQANGGTVFLDEIGDMPIGVQAKLLRLLQERQIERLGGRDPISVDVRIIAATNRDLEQAVAEGRFREDLFYRLNVVSLHLPPLRERREDIPHLAKHFIGRLSQEMEIPAPDFTDEALSLLSAHSWQGNVRQLRNLLQRTLIFNRGAAINGQDIVRAMHTGADSQAAVLSSAVATPALAEYVRQFLSSNTGDNAFDSLMDEMGALVVKEALTLCGGNRSRTAKILGLSRPTLLAKIDKYSVQKNET